MKRNFFVKRIPDRKAETLTKVLESVIGVCSNFCTDGYPSYPEVARNLHVVHHVLNHSLGFKSEDGTHKNNIEGFCAILKDKMRKEHDVRRENIDEWLKEFTFLKRFVFGKSLKETSELFFNIIKLLLSYFLF